MPAGDVIHPAMWACKATQWHTCANCKTTLIHLCRFSRECKKDYKYKEMTIPKGCVVTFPCYLLHKDPEYWKDPEKFDPMRYYDFLNSLNSLIALFKWSNYDNIICILTLQLDM